MKLSIIFISILLVTFDVNAITSGGKKTIYNAISFKCNYYLTSISQIKSNKYNTKLEKTKFEFSIVNISEKSGQMVGNAGTDEMVKVNGNPSGIHFIQFMPAGTMTTTTIYPEEVGLTNLAQRKFSSSHSRHISMIGGSLPQQFYGDCTLLE